MKLKQSVLGLPQLLLLHVKGPRIAQKLDCTLCQPLVVVQQHRPFVDIISLSTIPPLVFIG